MTYLFISRRSTQQDADLLTMMFFSLSAISANKRVHMCGKWLFCWMTKNNDTSTRESVLRRNAGTSGYQLQDTIFIDERHNVVYILLWSVHATGTNFLNGERPSRVYQIYETLRRKGTPTHIFVDLCHPVYSVPIRSFFSVYELRDCIDGKDNLVHRSDFTILTTDDSLWLENGERYLYGEGEIFITGWLFTASNVFPWGFITGGYISVTPENGKLVAWLLGV